ncbi:Bud-site selection protein [Mycena pura]|uniref:Bud-site selection protein n=1 Tax=Mycena pura TaxID=153505 RepID=A0AAD6YEC2_9AGAR|nr:Bud-site selection protein [Mycena pura]
MDVPTVPSTVPRGVKRKRPAPPEEHHALKDVRKAAKKARTFETQRVVKKLKSVRKKDPAARDVAILEAEIEELKTSSPDTFADTALRTRLHKDLHISSDASACAAIARELPTCMLFFSARSASTSASVPPSKVRARLLSSRVLAAAVSEAVLDLRALVLPPDAIAKAAHQADEDGENEDEDADETEGEKVEQEGDDDSVSETMDVDEDQAGWGLGSSGDADDGGWESGSVHSAADPDSSHSASEEVDSESPLEAPPAAKRAKPSPPKSTKPALAAKSSATTSQFLPSLAVGYIRGGSSDVEDIDAESKGRKNRRGQRARQAIWEKKYGRGANHKKKEAEEAAKANAKGWNVKGKVAKGRDGQYGAKRRERETESGAPREGKPKPWQPAGKPLTASSAPTGTPHMKTEAGAGLHPSWAAKRALKDRMGGGGGAIVSSQGKKIVFE